MTTFTNKSVLDRSPKRSPKRAWWRYCLGLVAAIFILSATDCSVEAIIGDQPQPRPQKPRPPACYGMNQLDKTIIPPEEPVALAGTYTQTDKIFTTTMTFTDGNVEFMFGRSTGTKRKYTGRYQYTEQGGTRWPSATLNGPLRREGDSDSTRAQIYRLEYDSCHSEIVGRPVQLAWLADGRLLIGSNDAPLRATHYYSAGGALITFNTNKPPFICQPSETSECNTFASLVPSAVPVPDTIRDITAGIAAGSARVFSTSDRELSFRPDNTFSYTSSFTRDDWATGGTWERIQRSGGDHYRVFIPAHLRATVSGGADSMFAQVYKISWNKPASTSNLPRRRPETVLWLTNNQVLISLWGPSDFSQPGITFGGRTLAGAEHLIPQTSP